ncbi:MAG: NACHT domain-containing protein [Rivularia sp. (in: cyanobacteria)]
MQQVRTRLHDSIQRLHGIMPLWGIDNWVPLGDLFVDVNILEKTSSSRRSEVGDLWQDFTKGESNYRSLDRIGLGNQQQRVSGLTVLERGTNLMVVGKPGSGKTTYLQRIVTECNNGKLQAQRIPVLIKLREFVDDGRKYKYNLDQFFSQLWRLSSTDIELVLSQGKALVLLDGLDEVTGEAGKQITREIKRFARIYPQVLVVVTCRIQSQESRFERFDYVEVADFNEKQVRTFAEHWFGTVCENEEEKQAREFLEQLFWEENKPIRELAITPLLLSLTCAVFQQTGKFYSKRSKLYEEGLELLLVQWDKSQEVERNEVYRDLSAERKLELLSYIAVKKFEEEQYVLFEQEELEGYIGEFLGIERRESQGVLRAIASVHGLLIERSHKVWSFSHLTFQEYLVATWFCKTQKWDLLASHVGQQYWKEIFFTIIELENKPEEYDEIFRIIKTETDKIMIDNELQIFLIWLNEKSNSIQTKLKPAAVRALYLSSVDPDIEISHDLPKCIDPKIKDIILDKYKFDVNIDNPWEITLDFALNPSKCPDFAEIRIAQELYPEFGKILIQFSNLVSDRFHNRERFLKWWRLHGREWNKNYRNVLINYRNIHHVRKFSLFQKNKISSYCYANQLLMDCLNIATIVNQNTREQIEATLLLPIAEIEKRKRENIE